jgi:hypothetical protein
MAERGGTGALDTTHAPDTGTAVVSIGVLFTSVVSAVDRKSASRPAIMCDSREFSGTIY